VRARLDVEPGVLVVVGAIAAERVAGAPIEVDAVGLTNVEPRVSGALVVFDGGPAHPRDQRDAMILVVVAEVRAEDEARPALCEDSVLPVPRSVAMRHREVGAGAAEVHAAILGVE